MSVEKVTHVAVPTQLFLGVINYITNMPTGGAPFAQVRDMVDALSNCQPVTVQESERPDGPLDFEGAAARQTSDAS